MRIEEYIGRYINGERYRDCLRSSKATYLINVKNGYYDLETARIVANTAMDNIDRVCDVYLKTCSKETNKEVDALLDDVQYNIMKIAIEKELK